jgi:hypothetical protein
VDAGRLLVVRRDAAYVLDLEGHVLGTALPPSGTAWITGRLQGDDLVLLRTALGGGHVLAVRNADGRLRDAWRLPEAATAGDGSCDEVAPCGQPALRLEDVHDGFALYVLDRTPYLVRLGDGRTAPVSVQSIGTVNAELDDSGLFVSYRVAGAWPGRVRFTPWSVLPAPRAGDLVADGEAP